MSAIDERVRRVDVERVENFRFRVRFAPDLADLLVDEPPPLGGGSGPDASRLLAAAIGNCLSASLTLCLTKSRIEIARLSTEAVLTVGRNAAGRLRILRGDVRLTLGASADSERLQRCLHMFEDYCTVTASVRQAFPISVVVTDEAAHEIHRSDDSVEALPPARA